MSEVIKDPDNAKPAVLILVKKIYYKYKKFLYNIYIFLAFLLN